MPLWDEATKESPFVTLYIVTLLQCYIVHCYIVNIVWAIKERSICNNVLAPASLYFLLPDEEGDKTSVDVVQSWEEIDLGSFVFSASNSKNYLLSPVGKVDTPPFPLGYFQCMQIHFNV